MTETDLIFQISKIVNKSASYPQAVKQIALLLSSFDPQCESLYRTRLADFVDQQLGMLIARTRLAERRAELKREIVSIRQDLAARKQRQRAEGLLIARRAMTSAAAKRWIDQQSQKTGLSADDVADRIIAHYRPVGLAERKIA